MQTLNPVIASVADRSAQAAQTSIISTVFITATHFPFRLVGNIVKGAFGTFVRAKPDDVMFSVTNVDGVWNTYMTHQFAVYGSTVAYKTIIYILVVTVIYHVAKGLVVVVYNITAGIHAQNELAFVRNSLTQDGKKIDTLTSG